MNKGLLYFIIIIFLCLPKAVFADSLPTGLLTTISKTNPGVTANQLSFQPVIQPRKFAPVTTAANVKPLMPIQGGSQIFFVLKKIDFVGNTVFSSSQLQAFASAYLNKSISIAQLQNLVEQITCKYRNAGYILSRAILPPQSIADGRVTVQIIEGKINKVTVCGHAGRALPLIQRYGDRIAASGPLRMQVLERYLLLANDIPGVFVRSVITPSQTTPGAAELTLVVQSKKVDVCLNYDNYGTEYLGPEEYGASLSVNSLITPGDRTTLQALASQDPRELRFVELTHSMPLNSNGLSLMLGANDTNTHPGNVLTPITVDGNAYTFYGTLTQNLVRSRAKNLNIFLTANYQNIDTNILNTPFYNDRIRSLIGGTYFDLTDRWHGYNTALFSIEQGFGILGASNNATVSRPNGHANFTKLNLELTRTQFLNSYFSFYLGGKGQYSFAPILAPEQFYFGGPCYGKGFEPQVILGDQGLAGTAEFRYDKNVNFCWLRHTQYYIFYDAGSIWNYSTPGLANHADATSCGVGLRFNFNRIFGGNIYVARPLIKPPADAVGAGINIDSMRVFFQLRASI